MTFIRILHGIYRDLTVCGEKTVLNLLAADYEAVGLFVEGSGVPVGRRLNAVTSRPWAKSATVPSRLLPGQRGDELAVRLAQGKSWAVE
jgi:hypothetical protein